MPAVVSPSLLSCLLPSLLRLLLLTFAELITDCYSAESEFESEVSERTISP